MASPEPTTLLELSSQFSNPSDVTTVLMIIGADVVQKALAQCTGTLYAPVCFSFGWVAFAYTSLMSILGDGRLLPAPDHPVKVFNLVTGYVRENRHWVVGRILRDHERRLGREFRLSGNGVRITVFEAVASKRKRNTFPYGWMHVFGVGVMAVQLGIAAVPIGLYRDWGIMLITAGGTALALWFGSLEQWRVEKLPNRQRSEGVFALTSGNGARDIMVIKGMGNGLDLEEWATTDTPRNGGPWEKLLAEKRRGGLGFLRMRTGEGERARMREGSFVWRSRDYVNGVPVGFVSTFVVCVTQSVLWLLLLITVAALKSNTWFLVAIGALGMFQNGMVAAWERRPEDRGLVLERKDVILTKKVMDGLMDLEAQHGCGLALVREFFPGKMLPDEEAWWNGDRDPYDDERSKQQHIRGPPRSRQMAYELNVMGEERSRRGPPEAREEGFATTEKVSVGTLQDGVVAIGGLRDPQHPSVAFTVPPVDEVGSSHLLVPARRALGRPGGRKFQPSVSPIPDNASMNFPLEALRNPFSERESPDWS